MMRGMSAGLRGALAAALIAGGCGPGQKELQPVASRTCSKETPLTVN